MNFCFTYRQSKRRKTESSKNESQFRGKLSNSRWRSHNCSGRRNTYWRFRIFWSPKSFQWCTDNIYSCWNSSKYGRYDSVTANATTDMDATIVLSTSGEFSTVHDNTAESVFGDITKTTTNICSERREYKCSSWHDVKSFLEFKTHSMP